MYEHLAALSARAGSSTPLLVAAHSLGSVIFCDHVWDEQKRRGPGRDALTRCETLAGFITFGSNIPLFTLGLEQVTSFAFPPPKLPKALKGVAQWNNYFDRDDVLGYPLREISPSYASAVTADLELSVGGFLEQWNPAAHTAYWDDSGFVRLVARQIVDVANAGAA